MNLIKQFLTQELRKKVSPNQLRRAIGKKAPSDRTVILRYNSQLQGAQKKINAEIRKAIQPLIAETLRSDALDPLGDFFNALEQSIYELLKITGVENIIKINADSIVNLNFRKYDTKLYNSIGINALPKDMEQGLIDNWIKQNTDLITNTNKTQLDKIQRLFRDNAFSGRRAASFEKELNAIYGGTRKNIALIARDQIGKLGGRLDQLKQTSAGVEGYYWRTSRDERVRDRHVDLEGKYFRWDKPPEDGHPGQPIQCRCDSEPALDRMLMEGQELKEALAQREKDDEIFRKEARERAELGKKMRNAAPPGFKELKVVPQSEVPKDGLVVEQSEGRWYRRTPVEPPKEYHQIKLPEQRLTVVEGVWKELKEKGSVEFSPRDVEESKLIQKGLQELARVARGEGLHKAYGADLGDLYVVEARPGGRLGVRLVEKVSYHTKKP